MQAKTFETVKAEIEQEVAAFNKKIVSIANNCETPILVRSESSYNPFCKCTHENPIGVFIKEMITHEQFTYGGAKTS